MEDPNIKYFNDFITDNIMRCSVKINENGIYTCSELLSGEEKSSSINLGNCLFHYDTEKYDSKIIDILQGSCKNVPLNVISDFIFQKYKYIELPKFYFVII